MENKHIMSFIKWLPKDDSTKEQGPNKNLLTLGTKMPIKLIQTCTEDEPMYTQIKLANEEFIYFESLVCSNDNESRTLKVQLIRIAPDDEPDANKKLKMKPEQLVNLENQIFSGELKFSNLKENLKEFKDMDNIRRKSRMELIRKVTRANDLQIISESRASVLTQMEQKALSDRFGAGNVTKYGNSVEMGHCFRTKLDIEKKEGQTESLFDCEHLYLKLRFKNENFELRPKNMFSTFNLTKIMSIIRPVEKFPEKSIEFHMKGFISQCFKPFQDLLLEFSQDKNFEFKDPQLFSERAFKNSQDNENSQENENEDEENKENEQNSENAAFSAKSDTSKKNTKETAFYKEIPENEEFLKEFFVRFEYV